MTLALIIAGAAYVNALVFTVAVCKQASNAERDARAFYNPHPSK